MAGLLDNKSRLIDAAFTLSGKSQAFAGGLRVKYVTFSDIGAKYEGDENEIAIYSSASLGFECYSTPWDTITVETDESGMMLSFAGDNFSLTPDGKVISSGSIGIEKNTIINGITAASLESFDNLQILSTKDLFLNDEGLSVQPKSYAFSITSNFPFSGEPPKSNIDDVDSFFSDKRLSTVPNFKYLPPLQKSASTAQTGVPLGNYANLSEENNFANKDPISNLANLEGVALQFSKRTEENTLAIQIFEELSGSAQKLDVIRYGPVGISPEGGQSSLYFVGKVYDDGFDVPTFVNIFTMVIE